MNRESNMYFLYKQQGCWQATFRGSIETKNQENILLFITKINTQ